MKTRAVLHRARFGQDARFGAPGDAPTLMNSYRAEVAFAVTAAVGGDGKTNGLHGAHFALRRVIWMHGMFKGQGVNRVHFLNGQGRGRRVLHHVTAAIALGQALRADGIVVDIERVEHFNKAVFVRADFFVGGQLEVAFRHFGAGVNQSAQTVRVQPIPQRICQGQHGHIRHAVEQVIRFGVQDYRAAQGIGPKIVVRNAP